MRKITLLFVMLYSITAFSARYLVDSGSGNIWSDPTASAGTRVDLSTAGAGGVSTTFAAWFAATTMVAGDEVWIASGTYVVAGGIALKDGVNIYGGFAGTETAVSGRSKGTNAWDFNNPTVIDYNNISPGTTGLNCAAAFVNATVVDGLSITKIAKSVTTGNGGIGSINGNITLQNCKFYANTFTRASGTSTVSGGLFMRTGSSVLNSYFYNNQSLGAGTGIRGGAITSAGPITVKGCLIENNSSVGNGGAIMMISNTATYSSGGTFEDCIIRNNTAGSGGGGIYHNTTQNKTGDILIKNCQITDNTATSGGAIEVSGSAGLTVSLSIEGCTFARNTSTTGNGAVNIIATPNTTVNYIKNCFFKDNSSTTLDGAALWTAKATPVYNCVFSNNSGSTTVYSSGAGSKIYNCTFANNAAVGLKFSAAATSCVAKNNIFWNNTIDSIQGGTSPAIEYNAYQPDRYRLISGIGTGEIQTLSADNTFQLPTTFTGKAVGESQINESNTAIWNLKAGAPAKNAGTDLTSEGITKDIAGTDRPYQSVFDMGAYETTLTTVVDKGNLTDIRISGMNNRILIEGLKSGQQVSLFSVNGALLSEFIASDFSKTIQVSKGIFLIRVDNLTLKAVVR